MSENYKEQPTGKGRIEIAKNFRKKSIFINKKTGDKIRVDDSGGDPQKRLEQARELRRQRLGIRRK